MSFKYTRLPCLVAPRRKRKREKFVVDDDFQVIVESTSHDTSPSRVDVRLKQRRRRFTDDIVLSEDSYDSLKQRLLAIRERLNHVRLDSTEAQSDLKNCFEFNDGVCLFVGLKENRRAFVDFSHLTRRSQRVTLNENQFSALENMISRSIIDGAIVRLWKCIE